MVISCVCYLKQILNEPGELPTIGLVQGVIHPSAFFSAVNQTGLTEYFHVVGQGGLGEMEIFQKHAGASFALLKQFDNAKAAFIGDGLQHDDLFFWHRFRDLLVFTDINILKSIAHRLTRVNM